jgi:hypothetical protein
MWWKAIFNHTLYGFPRDGRRKGMITSPVARGLDQSGERGV